VSPRRLAGMLTLSGSIGRKRRAGDPHTSVWVDDWDGVALTRRRGKLLWFNVIVEYGVGGCGLGRGVG